VGRNAGSRHRPSRKELPQTAGVSIMLRHACGYALANKGIDTRTMQAYLGHRSINSTTRYAALAPGRFKNIWGRM
jgi:site-specific recombinase XerD